LNPLRDLKLAVSLAGLYRQLKPAIVHHVTIKPVLYGGAAARWAGVPGIIHAIPGLGYLFTREERGLQFVRQFVGAGYRYVLGTRRALAIFQNEVDLRHFVDAGWITPDRAVLIPGSGVDVSRYLPTPEPEGPVTFVLPARILREKGVHEFAMAATLLRRAGSASKFVLAGGLDPENPGALSRREVEDLCAEHGLEWLGHVEGMPQLLAGCHVVCLPSYREGMPKALLEACAAGRPVITTDVPGCRAVVRHSVNGLLVPARDAAALASAMQQLEADGEGRQRFGAAGRARAVNEFNESLVVQRTMDLYERLRAS
jgi:glycosyltransferase involved in cell wall biosynthesis